MFKIFTSEKGVFAIAEPSLWPLGRSTSSHPCHGDGVGRWGLGIMSVFLQAQAPLYVDDDVLKENYLFLKK
jgi:hypothetical protein